jgi:hypothetical protein
MATHANVKTEQPIVERLKERIHAFDDDVQEMPAQGERADLWSDVDVPVDDLREAASAITALTDALANVSYDLEAELKHRWGYHPALQSKFERDMVPVIEARELIAKIRGGA